MQLKKAKYLGLILSIIGVLLVGCDDKSTDYTGVLNDALSNLRSTGNYIVSNTLSAPDGDIYYLTVTTSDGVYTEYPIDENGSYGTLSYDEVSENQQYILTDYWADSSNYYMVATDHDVSTIYKYPASYANACRSKGYMYFDEILDGFTSIHPDNDITVGDEVFKTYKCVLNKDTVAKLFGKTNLALYQSVYDSTIHDEGYSKANTKALELITDYKKTLVFSDADVIVGIDDVGKLRYIDLVAGGLGTKIYLKMYVMDKPFTPRTLPDFSSYLPYASLLNN